jgi:DNA polymerase III epsilon subunit-like protein
MTVLSAWHERDYAVVDVEGDGQQPADLVELAIVHISSGHIGEPVVWLVRPPGPIAWRAQQVHGITDEHVAGAEPFEAVHDDVLAHLGGAVIVGHHVGVDLQVLYRKLPYWRPAHVIDTLRLARALLPDAGSHRLAALAGQLELTADTAGRSRPHRAAYDALLAARLLRQFGGMGERARTWHEICELGGLPQRPDPQVEAPVLF